jgi:cellulose synthase/poly-beta-1,6-N-acetylglucosamine synthase-like glycosyltransferase
MIFWISIFILCYVFFVFGLWLGWQRITTHLLYYSEQEISVVVAFRNEVDHLPHLLDSFSRLNYDLSKVHFIFVNDHSTDQFSEVFQRSEYRELHIQCLHLGPDQFGKKQALQQGVVNATTEWVMFTDADCEVSANWIGAMLSTIKLNSLTNLVFGPVRFFYKQSFLMDFQTIDFLSLIGSGAALWHWKRPVMCNGANLLVRKASYLQHFSTQGTESLSGDDVYMMLSLHAQNDQQVAFCKDANAMVSTHACSSWAQLFQQRLRWASKFASYKLWHVKFIALWVVFVNVVSAFLIILVICTPWNWDFALLLGMKILADFIFIRAVSQTYEISYKTSNFFLVSIIYPFFVITFGVLGRFMNFNWKGRNGK